MLCQLGNLTKQLFLFVVVGENLEKSKVDVMRVIGVKLPFENQMYQISQRCTTLCFL